MEKRFPIGFILLDAIFGILFFFANNIASVLSAIATFTKSIPLVGGILVIPLNIFIGLLAGLKIIFLILFIICVVFTIILLLKRFKIKRARKRRDKEMQEVIQNREEVHDAQVSQKAKAAQRVDSF